MPIVLPKIDINKLESSSQKAIEENQEFVNSVGMSGDNIAELNPKFRIEPYEVVYSGKHDSHIVLGRDRAGYILNNGGYGSLGHTSCASIDIVVGRKSAAENFDIKNDFAEPDFFADAARIYVSQKSDMDDYFGLPGGKSGFSIARSGIGLKADAVRIIGRESIKLVIGTDTNNSRNGVVNTNIGIELIAGNVQNANLVLESKEKYEDQISEIIQKKDGMQPIPLGINTAFAISVTLDKLDKLAAAISTQTMTIISFMNEVAYHIHPDLVNPALVGTPIGASAECIYACTSAAAELMSYTIKDVDSLRAEIRLTKAEHLRPGGPYYINSPHHSLN